MTATKSTRKRATKKTAKRTTKRTKKTAKRTSRKKKAPADDAAESGSAIEAEILRLTDAKPQGARESDVKYRARLVRALNDAITPDDDGNADVSWDDDVSEELQDYHSDAVDAIKAKEPVPEFPDAPEGDNEDDDEPDPKKRAKRTKKASKKTVKRTTKRAKKSSKKTAKRTKKTAKKTGRRGGAPKGKRTEKAKGSVGFLREYICKNPDASRDEVREAAEGEGYDAADATVGSVYNTTRATMRALRNVWSKRVAKANGLE